MFKLIMFFFIADAARIYRKAVVQMADFDLSSLSNSFGEMDEFSIINNIKEEISKNRTDKSNNGVSSFESLHRRIVRAVSNIFSSFFKF